MYLFGLILVFVAGAIVMFGSDDEAPASVWDDVRYFQPFEFDSPDVPGSGQKVMKLHFIKALDELRGNLGYPLQVNSGYRTPEHNARVGGVPDSAHLKGLAADIYCPTKEHLRKIVYAAREMGFRRIGQYFTVKGNYFVHLDLDDSKEYQGEWCFINGSKSSTLLIP
ncbi:MAG: D-Ala-D-Ala carboxypeptidase family metallohydrolase [Chitinophagales bacterium]|nr:D-Ala-D-Ala carboxypeptidase family metallohydrolase [Chitinophagales bacterium]